MRALQIGAFLAGVFIGYGQLGSALATPPSAAQQALESRRAAQVLEQRNTIVSKTLESVGVPYETDPRGVPVWIELGGRRMDVRRVEVSPIANTSDHEVAITTAQGTLLLRRP